MILTYYSLSCNQVLVRPHIKETVYKKLWGLFFYKNYERAIHKTIYLNRRSYCMKVTLDFGVNAGSRCNMYIPGYTYVL